ncbi:hypothetical protein M0R45_033637 [Rubus argutus]|uniref:NAD(P)-binding domain-containing protein n=1 Tax=Rubus argutus TaxID=59490 RepID=A0AAW1WMW6_RUBAR
MGIARLQEREEDFELVQQLLAAVQDKQPLPEKRFSFKSACLAVVNRLLVRGYSVRIIVNNPEDVEKLREMTTGNVNNSVVMASLTNVESLSQAFQGCRGVFHTSGFTDPAGLSGYTKSMAEIEVVKAITLHRQKALVCLGKLKAEKAAWTIAKDYGLKLTTICPGLITGPEFALETQHQQLHISKEPRDVPKRLASNRDVMRLADAHVGVYEAMNKSAFGRYICFDQVIETEQEAEKLAGETSMSKNKICGNNGTSSVHHPRYELSNRKLISLLSKTLRFCYNKSHEFY